MEKSQTIGTRFGEKLQAMSETALANRISCVSMTILVSVISIAYILEVVKGNRSLPYVLVTIALAYPSSAHGVSITGHGKITGSNILRCMAFSSYTRSFCLRHKMVWSLHTPFPH